MNTFETIKQSCEPNDKVSSTRLISYIIITLITLLSFYFIGMGIYIGIKSATILPIEQTKEGVRLVIPVIPNELIIVYTSLLAHQLALLGISKYNETKQKKLYITPESKDNSLK
jgi:hypothetical protein